MKSIKAQIAIGIVCIILGFTITLQLKSVKVNYDGNEVLQRSGNLLKELNNQKDKNADLLEQIMEMRAEIESFRSDASESSDYAKLLSEQLKKAEILSGLTAVEGPGVKVTMNDSKEASTKNPENYIIHDDDIRKIINELYAAGAEAISINDDRLISTSAVRCVGPVVIVNNNKYSPPYVIKAIGNPETLIAALNQREGVVDILRSIWKIEIDVKKEELIKIQRYNGVLNFKYVTATKEEN